MWIGYLRQSTAAVRRTPQFVGVDGLAEQTAVSSPAGRITKNGAASAFAAASWSHDANGYYLLGLSASHTDTIGAGTIQFASSASYLSVTLEFTVLHPAVYDWLFGSTAPSTYAGGAVTLAASQPDYAPATASALAALVATVGAAGAGLTAVPPVTLAAAQPNYAPATQSALAGLVATVGTNGAGLTAVPDPAGVGTLLTRLTSTRAGHLDNLAGGPVALASQIPAEFTAETFAAAGVFAAEALANAPAVGGPVVLAADQPDYAPAKADALASLVATVGASGAGLTAIPRAGYKLASDGLDAIATAEPTVAADGPMSGWKFPQLLRWLVMRFSRASLTPDALTVRTLAGSASTVQAVADDGAGNESTGAPQ